MSVCIPGSNTITPFWLDNLEFANAMLLHGLVEVHEEDEVEEGETYFVVSVSS